MDTNDKPGCVGSILRALGLGAAPVVSYTPVQDDPLSSADVSSYRVRDDLLSPAELSFYHVLRTAASEWATICPKVSLDDLFYAKSGDHRANASYRNRIARKHVDFLLCDPQTMFPLLAIELDDSSHQQESRQARDRFVEKVFAVTGLPLLRMPVHTAYNTRELSAALRRTAGLDRPSSAVDLGSGGTPPAESTDSEPPTGASIPARDEAMISARMYPSAADAANQPPACPRCGQPMVLRVVSKEGPHKGKQFWGCRDFPHCRGVREYATEASSPA
jgi:Protein of unknown function (DUF2726)/GRF zinc finger